MKRLPNIHPGTILQEEFLDPLKITAYRLAKETELPQTRISQILHSKRSITADTAIRLSKFFGTSPQFWLGLQNDYDLEEVLLKKDKSFKNISNYKDLAKAS
jgi:addiction module HigA family antidote